MLKEILSIFDTTYNLLVKCNSFGKMIWGNEQALRLSLIYLLEVSAVYWVVANLLSPDVTDERAMILWFAMGSNFHMTTVPKSLETLVVQLLVVFMAVIFSLIYYIVFRVFISRNAFITKIISLWLYTFAFAYFIFTLALAVSSLFKFSIESSYYSVFFMLLIQQSYLIILSRNGMAISYSYILFGYAMFVLLLAALVLLLYAIFLHGAVLPG